MGLNDIGKDMPINLLMSTFMRLVFLFDINVGVGAEKYTGRVACSVSHCKYADGTERQTNGRTPDRYITLSDKRGQRSNFVIAVKRNAFFKYLVVPLHESTRKPRCPGLSCN